MTAVKTTKRGLLLELQELLCDKCMYNIDGINANSSKAELQNAINCLRCSDEVMAEYLTVIKLKYPNIHRAVTESDYLIHSHNRLYVYNTARQVIG